jgi:GTPase SAR1 family protein
MEEQKQDIIKSIVFSIFDDDGPTPKIYWPIDMEESARLLVAMKTISILMGDAIYQNGNTTEGISYFGILPFPDLKLNGLTYFFLIPDENARGNAKAATITALIDEANKGFFYENMKYLRVIIDKSATKIQESKIKDEINLIIDELRKELLEFTSALENPLSGKQQLKILITGLANSGKTSFLLGVKKRYSEIIKILPTKGVSRSNEKIFDEQNSRISIWDIGGQQKYLERFLQESKFYLYNIDVLFYFIDIQDDERVKESLDLFHRIIEILRNLNESPPIVICLNKFDPDLKESKKINKLLKRIIQEIEKNTEGFYIKIFETSIFNHWSLISAYSYGLSQLSPNKEIFKNQLKSFAKSIDSDSILLLSENGIILSSYSNSEISEKLFAISAPHFQTLYKTFHDFKLLKKDFLISSGTADNSKVIVFKKVIIGTYNLYLLLYLKKKYELSNVESKLPNFSENIRNLMLNYI